MVQLSQLYSDLRFPVIAEVMACEEPLNRSQQLSFRRAGKSSILIKEATRKMESSRAYSTVIGMLLKK